MKHIKRVGVAFILTILLVLCAFGFWLADYQSGKIAFSNHNTRIDVIVENNACEIEWREKSFQFTLPDTFLKVTEIGQKLLPPDIQGIFYWLTSLNK